MADEALNIAPEATSGKEEDEELNALLDEALEDFQKQELADNKDDTPDESQNEHEQRDGGCTASTSDSAKKHPFLTEYADNEEFQKLAEDFTKALEGMPEEDYDALQDFGRMVLTQNFETGEVKTSDVEESLSRAFEALKQNMANVEGNLDADLDSQFIDTIKNMGFSEGGEEGFFEMMQGFMKELVSKDVLYPSLSEMASQYPSWLEQNKAKLTETDYQRYSSQYDTVQELCSCFEKEDAAQSEEERKSAFDNKLVLIQKMQKCGQPPTDLMSKIMKDADDLQGASAANGNDCVLM